MFKNQQQVNHNIPPQNTFEVASHSNVWMIALHYRTLLNFGVMLLRTDALFTLSKKLFATPDEEHSKTKGVTLVTTRMAKHFVNFFV
jgi:hypothetical protein